MPAALFPVLSVTKKPYVPAKVPAGTTTDPDTWPVVADMEHVGLPNAGTVTAVQLVARELKPEPVKVNTVLTVPDVGVTITSGVTVNDAAGVRSSTGVPSTFTFHGISVVAYGLTTKVPCAIPGVEMEHVELVIRVLSDTAPLYDCTLHAVSDGFRPVPTKVTVDSSTALLGDSVRVGAL
jgi:hypothetical protein